jgi:crotonobetainyl-CoA:carnitine CoA-transferase CaiB-like acyl-CoA transferase
MFLSDFGAEVIHIRRPQDVLKGNWDQTTPTLVRLLETSFNATNRNKKSMILDLRSEEGRKILYALAKTTDVIVEGFRPGITAKLNIDYETMRQINPRIIYCSISGYGQEGPYAQLPGHDINYIAMGGVLDMIGQAGGPPAIPMNLIADFAGGSLHATIGILLALMAREKTGQGQYVDIAYLDGVLSLLTIFAYDYFDSGEKYRRGTTVVNGGSPCYNVYETKDGKYIAIGCLEPWFWKNLCRFAGKEEFIPHQHTGGEKEKEIFVFFREYFLTKSRDEWFDLCGRHDIPLSKVHTLSEVFADPQVIYRGSVTKVGDENKKSVGICIKLSETPGEIRNQAPVPGQHTRELLLQMGYSATKIEEFRNKGVIGLSGPYKNVTQ